MTIYLKFNVLWALGFCGLFASSVLAQDKTKFGSSENKTTVPANEVKSAQETENQKSAVLSEDLLPAETRLWISLPNASALKESFDSTKFGELTRKESLKPFIDKTSKQIKNWLDEKNFELGIKTDDFAELHTGEICIAAVLPEDGDSKNYGFAILVDVTDTQLKAKELLAKLKVKLEKREATSSDINISGLKAVQWDYPAPIGLRRPKFAFHILTEKWLLVCDNKEIATQICNNIVGKKSTRSLAESEIFQKVRDETKYVEVDAKPQIKFFLEPFGYFDIIQDIAKQNARAGELSNDHIRQLRASGFDAIKGVGGNISVGGKYEIIAKAFVYAPSNSDVPDRKYKDSAEMLRFDTADKHELIPENFVPVNSSGYLTLTWDMARAFKNVEPLFDRIMNKGAFQDLLNNIHKAPEGPQVDLAEFVGQFHNRISIFTENIPPINETSEKIVLGFKVRDGEAQDIFTKFRRMIPDAEVVEFEGQIMLIDQDIKDDGPPGFKLDIGDDDEDEFEEEEPPKPLFDKRVYAIVDGNLLLGNDPDYVKKIITDAKAEGGIDGLKKSEDLRLINSELNKFVDTDKITLRQFFRLDESIRVHYEMLRAGKMGSSATLLSKVLNQVLMPQDAPEDAVREQKIDGSDLPTDFMKEVAPFLGSGGFALETEENGWTLTGLILKKNERENVASKPNDNPK